MSERNGSKESPEPQTTEKTATVDWLTVTVKDLTRQGHLADEAGRLMEIAKDMGNVQRPWNFKGYDGYLCAGLRWGTRADSSILMLSGEAASLNWPIALAWCDKCTRVDLAVTVTLLEPKTDVAADAYYFLCPDFVEVRTHARKMSFIRNNSGGQTFYIGSRMSDQFGRLYDKGRESGEETDTPTGLIWRYEVEFKSYRADRVGQQLLEAAKEERPYHETLGETVYKWFLSRGVSPIFSPYNSLPFSTEVSAKLSDDDVTLRWLSTQVAPSVKRLYERGRGEEVNEALGILTD